MKELSKFAECKHIEEDSIDSDCIHCQFAWCLERIKYLEANYIKPSDIEDKGLLTLIQDTHEKWFRKKEIGDVTEMIYNAITSAGYSRNMVDEIGICNAIPLDWRKMELRDLAHAIAQKKGEWLR